MAAGGLRRRVYEALDHGAGSGRLARATHRFLIALIVANVVVAVAESTPEFDADAWRFFFWFEVFSVTVFCVEYLARLWAAPEHAPLAGLGPMKARLAYAVTPSMLIDLAAILPFFVAMALDADLRVLILLRLVRFFKLARYSPGLGSLFDAIRSERRALGACFVIFLGGLLVSSSLMHIVERFAQPDKFGSIPHAMWWSIVTLTTIGYGDVVPITPLGKLVAAFTAFLGLIMLALPGGIIASAFAREIQRRDFVVTWGMVAKVPLFAGLDAQSVAEIMQLLRSAAFGAGEVIAWRGEAAHSMYFVTEGEVTIDLPDQCVTLGSGDFFGEIAVLQRSTRSGTVKARTRVKLLVLEAEDLHHLMMNHPEIDRRIRKVAAQRLQPERLGPRSDLVEEELHPHGREPSI